MKYDSLESAIANIGSMQERAAQLRSDLSNSLSIQQMRPDIFKHGTARLSHMGKHDPKQPRAEDPVFRASMCDGNGHHHRLNRAEYAALDTGIAIHSEYQ
jgi:hypothetical protein